MSKPTNRDNQAVQVNSDNVVIKYRETLQLEKTCDYAVPTDIATGYSSTQPLRFQRSA